MSQATDRPSVPDDITSSSAKLVYLQIALLGEASIRDLERALGMPKLRLFGVLDALEGSGIVVRRGKRYTCEDGPDQ